MTEKEYRAHPAISRSELWRIEDSPEKFQYYREHPPAPTPALVFGQLLHKLALEPEGVWQEFAVAPACSRRSKEGQALWQHFLERSAGKTVVTLDMVEQASAMCRALREKESCAEMLENAKETPFFWTDDITGEACKCRCDIAILDTDEPLIVDLKTTSNAKQDVMNHHIFKYGYHFQAAMYTEGVMQAMGLSKRPGFRMIAQEKTPPYAINIIDITPDVMLAGELKFRELIGIYHSCKETGFWYGYNGPFDMPNETYLPGYMSLGDKEDEE